MRLPIHHFFGGTIHSHSDYVARIYSVNLVSPKYNSNYSRLVTTTCCCNGPGEIIRVHQPTRISSRTTNSSLFTSVFGVKSLTLCLLFDLWNSYLNFSFDSRLMIGFLACFNWCDFATMNVAITNQPYSMIPTPNMNVNTLLLWSIFSSTESRLCWLNVI